MNSKNNLKKNGSGCNDPTAFEAIKSVTKYTKNRDQEVKEAITLVKKMFKKFDMEVINRMYIKDKKTGKRYK